MISAFLDLAYILIESAFLHSILGLGIIFKYTMSDIEDTYPCGSRVVLIEYITVSLLLIILVSCSQENGFSIIDLKRISVFGGVLLSTILMYRFLNVM